MEPCEMEDEYDCETCQDTGNTMVRNGQFVFDAPCGDCWQGDWYAEILRDSAAGR